MPLCSWGAEGFPGRAEDTRCLGGSPLSHARRPELVPPCRWGPWPWAAPLLTAPRSLHPGVPRQPTLSLSPPGVCGPQLPHCLLLSPGKVDLGGRNFPGIKKGPFSISGDRGCPRVPQDRQQGQDLGPLHHSRPGAGRQTQLTLKTKSAHQGQARAGLDDPRPIGTSTKLTFNVKAAGMTGGPRTAYLP